ncbi:MAG: M6 family metalloprotease domain-containing protein [Gemmatimonadales bacterium]
MRPRLLPRYAILLALGGATAALERARAQDIEAVAAVSGRRLPEGYYERIAAHPDFFTLERAWIGRAESARRSGQAVSGELPVVAVLGLFADSPDPTIQPDELRRVLFEGPYEHGTLAEYYSEVSGARLTITGEVFDWVRTNVTLAQAVGTSYGLGDDAMTGQFLVEALSAADSTTDFSLFDSDGPDGIANSGDDDGYVDVVAFYFHEIAASCGGPGIWPHRSRISGWQGSPYTTDDLGVSGTPIRIDGYIIQSVVDCSGTEIQTASTISHEMGHVLGLPDLYHPADGLLPEQRRWVVGCWGLMAAGAWGCQNIDRETWVRPTHMSAWAKRELGWISQELTVESTQLTEVTLEPVITSGKILRVPLSATEYLLVEYRKLQGFDQGLPAEGVIIYHIDPELPFRPCQSCPRLYRVALEEADGNDALIHTPQEGGNRGEPGDAWGAQGSVQFSNFGKPTTRLNSGQRSPVTFYSIAVEDSLARLTLSTVALALERALEPFLLNGAEPLIQTEIDFLDSIGNGNGRYDVGDLRAYLGR